MSDERQAAIRARFDERADQYDQHVMHRKLAQAVAAFADLGGVETVLDVATGTGLVLRALAARHPSSLQLVGVDLSPGMLAVARRELPSARFIEGEAETLPVADASADLVTCVTALHIFANPLAVFEEFARVLAPEGALVTATFAQVPGHVPGHGHVAGHGQGQGQSHGEGQGQSDGEGQGQGQGHGPGAPSTPGYEPNHRPFQTPEALAATAAPAGFVVTRWRELAVADDTVLLAELTPAD